MVKTNDQANDIFTKGLKSLKVRVMRQIGYMVIRHEKEVKVGIEAEF